MPQYIFYRHDTKRTLDMSRTSKTAHMASGAVRPSLKCMFLIKLSRFLVHNLIKITKVESMHEKLERLQMMPAQHSSPTASFDFIVVSHRRQTCRLSYHSSTAQKVTLSHSQVIWLINEIFAFTSFNSECLSIFLGDFPEQHCSSYSSRLAHENFCKVTLLTAVKCCSTGEWASIYHNHNFISNEWKICMLSAHNGFSFFFALLCSLSPCYRSQVELGNKWADCILS